MKRLFAVLALFALAACGGDWVNATMEGKILRVSNASYEQVWQASYDAVVKDFYRTSAEGKSRGEILAGSNGCAYGPGNYVGVFITPVNGGETKFHTIKIVADSEGDKTAEQITAEISNRIQSQLAGISSRQIKIISE